MRKFLIGVVVGIILASTGVYAVAKEKAKKMATKENAEKVGNAANSFADTIKAIFYDDEQ